MNYIISISLLIAAVIHMLPISGVLGAGDWSNSMASQSPTRTLKFCCVTEQYYLRSSGWSSPPQHCIPNFVHWPLAQASSAHLPFLSLRE